MNGLFKKEETFSQNLSVEFVCVVADLSELRPGSSWAGDCTQVSDGSRFPQIMKVETRDGLSINEKIGFCVCLFVYFFLFLCFLFSGNKFAGTMLWPTLNQARTKFRGEIDVTSATKNITFEEYEVIKGENDVEVPVKYVAHCKGDLIEGHVESVIAFLLPSRN